MDVRYYILRDVKPRIKDMGADEYRLTVADPDLYRNRIAFDTLLYCKQENKIYLGLMAFDSDIFYRFNPESNSFESLGYSKVGEKYEVKIHRSLVDDGDHFIYGATAGLHDVSLRNKAPGGRLFRYDKKTQSIEFLGIPCPHEYIQTITLDPERKILYGLTYPVFKFFRFDIETRKTIDFGYIGSITHISALDDQGRFWGTWHQRYHYLFYYDPNINGMNFFDHGLPLEGGNVMYPGAGPVDCMINGQDGYLYIGTTSGALIRLDPRNAKCEYLGKPYPEQRMPSLEIGSNGLIYGCGGDKGKTYIFSYDRGKSSFQILGQIQAPDGLKCYRTHDMCIVGNNRFFIGETDHPRRAGYLWECRLNE